MKFQPIMTYQRDIKRVRLCRVIYAKGRRQLSLGLEPRLWVIGGTSITVLGVRLHRKSSGGGIWA